jgi:hypothetical protein
MKPGYTIESDISKTDNFFYLFNFKPLNKITIYGFSSETKFNIEYLVGVWKIKKSNETNI